MATKRTKVEHHGPYICPVCHKDQATDDNGKAAGEFVDHDAGTAYCCSDACASMFAAHCDMPEPRQPLA